MERRLTAVCALALSLAAAWASADAAWHAIAAARCAPRQTALQPPPAVQPFPDLDPHTPEGAALAWLQRAGIVRGDAAGRMGPERPLTLAEAVVLLVRATGATAAAAQRTPAAEAGPAWAAEALATARALAWIGADDPPHRRLTWSEALALLLRATGGVTAPPADPVAEGRRLGVLAPWQARTLDSQAVITRGDFAVVLLAALTAGTAGDGASAAPLLARRAPEVYRAFVALHPAGPCPR